MSLELDILRIIKHAQRSAGQCDRKNGSELCPQCKERLYLAGMLRASLVSNGKMTADEIERTDNV